MSLKNFPENLFLDNTRVKSGWLAGRRLADRESGFGLLMMHVQGRTHYGFCPSHSARLHVTTWD